VTGVQTCALPISAYRDKVGDYYGETYFTPGGPVPPLR